MRVGFAVAVLLNLLTSSDAHCSSTDSGSCHLQVMIATVSSKHSCSSCSPCSLAAGRLPFTPPSPGVLAAPSARPTRTKYCSAFTTVRRKSGRPW